MKTLEFPLTLATVRALRVGQLISFRGTLFTGRDRVHEHLAEGRRPPVDLAQGVIFHCGPVALRTGGAWIIRSAGPTTSMRQEPYMASIIERWAIRMIIGKGGMGDATRRACVRHGCVYVQAVGGAGVALATTVRAVKSVHFLEEFGEAEALWELEVKELRGVVTMDTRGGSLHHAIQMESRRMLDRLLWDNKATYTA